MTVKELVEHFSEECMVNVKIADDDVDEWATTDFHDFACCINSYPMNEAMVVTWFYAKYEGECDELVVWIKEV